jgi:serine/threonine protein kinase
MENYDEYIGKQFGDYIIDKFINRGAWGIVFKARDLELKEEGEVALKILKPTEIALKQFKERQYKSLYDVFVKEKIAIKKNNCKNIVTRQFYSYSENDEKLGFIVMPLYGTEKNEYKDSTLEFLLREKHYQRGIDKNNLDRIIYEILMSINEVQGVLNRSHSDIKPDNFVVEYADPEKPSDFNNLTQIIVSDLGTTSMFEYEKTNEKMRNNIGYIYTRSPENFKGEHPTYQSDVWALGSLFYRLITGKYIIQDELDNYENNIDKINFMKNLSIEEGNQLINHKIKSNNKIIPKHLRKILYKSLNFDPNERYVDSFNLYTDYVQQSIKYPIHSDVFTHIKKWSKYSLIGIAGLAILWGTDYYFKLNYTKNLTNQFKKVDNYFEKKDNSKTNNYSNKKEIPKNNETKIESIYVNNNSGMKFSKELDESIDNSLSKIFGE